MLWSHNDGVVIADPNGVSWTEAIKQQRAYEANEARVAAMYVELDAQEELNVLHDQIPQPAPVMDSPLSPFATELVGLILKDEREKSLTASLAQSMDAIAQRHEADREERAALVAALSAIGQPVINVAPADVQVDVNVPPAEVTVEAAQIHLPAPEITVQAAPAPIVTVSPEIIMPSSQKTITFERDFDGRVTKADVTEQ